MSLATWYLLLALWLGVIGAACLATGGDCLELQYSSNATGEGLHMIALENNSSRIDISVGGGYSIVRCNVTGMWEVDIQ